MLLRVARAPQARQQGSSVWQTNCHLDQRYVHRSHKIRRNKSALAPVRVLHACSEHSASKTHKSRRVEGEAFRTLEDTVSVRGLVWTVPHAVHVTR